MPSPVETSHITIHSGLIPWQRAGGDMSKEENSLVMYKIAAVFAFLKTLPNQRHAG
jgi:hypothetical protein